MTEQADFGHWMPDRLGSHRVPHVLFMSRETFSLWMCTSLGGVCVTLSPREYVSVNHQVGTTQNLVGRVIEELCRPAWPGCMSAGVVLIILVDMGRSIVCGFILGLGPWAV